MKETAHFLIKPPALKPGDTIGIVAPASPLVSPDYLERGIKRLESWGFRVALARSIYAFISRKDNEYLAGSDGERKRELESMFTSPEVKAIICLRGGYGSLRLLPQLNYGLFQANPKIFVGYSDITALHIAITQRARLVTFHGPMIYPELGGEPSTLTISSFLAVLTGPPHSYTLSPLPGAHAFTITPGRASGRLVGGNLSLLVATLGTPFEVDTKGAVLFWEEVGEPLYRIDRLLTQLLLSGKLQAAAGIAMGECVGCGDLTEFRELLEDLLRPLGIPSFYGFPCGHGLHHFTLPLGTRVTLDATEGWLRLEELPVS
ncbi:MAG: LD-carboxypeptidase [Thermanaeromonas sp.]|uniref:S66 peptidase family protein n=1 Tax=Thermanaeromonas sp. TaxID=2003697 RepID=UPI0024383C1A|nr:LD-carboxypeptidase [Thermanaeromonas sp.]MCG0277903.1 LD-carboxypeptidase [Thermanaeromonas sp.]